MTIKELSIFTGKTVRTIRTWISKCDSIPYDKTSQGSEETSQGIPIDYSIDEVESILNSGSMSKDAVKILMENARNKNIPVVPEGVNSNTAMVLMFMEKLQEQNQQFINTMFERFIGDYKSEIKPIREIEYVPEPSPRRIFVNKVAQYAGVSKKNYSNAYKSVYDEIGMCLGIRVSARAKTRKVKGIDVLEQDGYLLKSIVVIDRMITSERGIRNE